MSLSKRKRIQSLPPPRKKRKSTSAIEEISFDPAARADYLTGFHKRKLQRIKHAKDEAAKREREERITARKLMRDERKADLERHVEAVNAGMRGIGPGQDEEESGTEASGERERDWDGMPEVLDVNREEEYVDEDKFTTVTVEAVDVGWDGLHKVHDDDEGEEEDRGMAERERGGERTGKRLWTKEPPLAAGRKKKKKKFKYESKAERKVTRRKERMGSKAQAKMRRD